MSEHYPRNMVEVSAWRRKCERMTPHTVSDRRLGYCIPCYEKPLPAAPVREETRQAELFK